MKRTHKRPKKPAALDPSSYHEVMDRAELLANTFDKYIVGHPVLLYHAELRKLADVALDALLNVYNEAGKLRFAQPDCEKVKP